MAAPAYHLRTNKAVDRFIFVDALRCLDKKAALEKYVYYGFGGPYLEDFRLVHENFPGMKMVSIEEDVETYKRQKFHRPSSNIKLLRRELGSFLSEYDPKDKKSIFWLDYTGLQYSQIEEFMSLLQRSPAGSVVKITLQAQPGHYHDDKKAEDFVARFKKVWPDSYKSPPRDSQGFACLLQEMLQIASQQALPSMTGVVFQPLCSFFYRDGLGIFTLTGIMCRKEGRRKVREDFSGWSFANLHWAKPKLIDVPTLSSKERLHLQAHLPCRKDAGRTLVRSLGYKIDSDKKANVEKMKQYARFYVQYPYFIRAVP